MAKAGSKLPSLNRIKALVTYSKKTGLFRYVGDSRHQKDKIAGTLTRQGYVALTLDGKRMQAHRVAWLMITGSWPKFEIDHRNRVRSDNHWRNLREATKHQNHFNLGPLSTNKSGFRGVSAFGKKWRAVVVLHKKQYHLGLFKTKNAAHRAYVKAAVRLYGRFYRG